MKSERDVLNDLDAMQAILQPFDDEAREGMLATMIAWFLSQQEVSRDVAIESLLERVAEIESGEREALQ